MKRRRRSVLPYVEALLSYPVEFFAETTLGTWCAERHIRLDVHHCESADELLHVLAHEVVHAVDPHLNESAVEARATWLKRRPLWAHVARSVLCEGLFRLVQAAVRKRPLLASVELVLEEVEDAGRRVLQGQGQESDERDEKALRRGAR